ncbi:MAG: hypothetical protein PUB34_01010 [Clostridia bacterium]|nr:hypothetical protein [Clostridia bacterium]
MEPNDNYSEQSVSLEKDTIDLRGNESHSAPQEKKYKRLLFAGLLTIPVLVVMIIASQLFFAYAMAYSNNALFFGLLIVSVPFALASIPFLLHAKAKFSGSGTKRKMEKGASTLLYILAILMVASAMVCGFSKAFSSVGLLNMFSVGLFIIMAITFIMYCNAVSNQSGVEAYYCFAKAMLVAFILSSPVGFALGMLLRLLEKAIIAVIVLFVVFIFFGGSVIYYRRG